MSSEVRRASHTHQVPQVGLPHSEPVHSAMKVNSAPVGAIALAIMPESRVLNARPTPAQKAITTYRNIDIHAAGTWMKMMRYDSPCWASLGATKNPMFRPIAQARAASVPKKAASLPARGKKVWGEEYLNQLMLMWLFDRDTQRRRRRPRRERRGDDQHCPEEQELRVSTQARGRRFRRARADHQHRDVQRQHQQREERTRAPQSQGQRRADRADEAQDRRAQRQRQDQNPEQLSREVEL